MRAYPAGQRRLSKEAQLDEIEGLDFRSSAPMLAAALPAELTPDPPHAVLEKPRRQTEELGLSVPRRGVWWSRRRCRRSATQCDHRPLVITDGAIAFNCTDVPGKLSIRSQITTAVGNPSRPGAPEPPHSPALLRTNRSHETPSGDVLSLRDPQHPTRSPVKIFIRATVFEPRNVTDPIHRGGIDLRSTLRGDKHAKSFLQPHPVAADTAFREQRTAAQGQGGRYFEKPRARLAAAT